MRQRSLDQLSEPMLARARARLAVVALLLGVVFNAMALSGLGWFVWGGADVVARYSQDVDLITANLWLLLGITARSTALSHVQVLRAGQGVVVTSCLAMAFLNGANAGWTGREVPVLTWAPLIIATYPLLVPSAPRVTLGVVTLAALAAPVGVAVGGAWSGAFSAPAMVASVVAPLVAGVLAVVGSDLIYGTAVDIEDLREQEALLQAVLGGVDEAILLRKASGEEVFVSATEMPEEVARAAAGLLVSRTEGRAQTWLVTHKPVTLAGAPHRLTVARRITAALDEAEVESWKRLIRALSHELNNSLAPMSSLLHSVRLMLDQPRHRERLPGAIASLERRVEHLSSFLAEYSGFARLPRPRASSVSWTDFVEGLQPLVTFTVRGAVPDHPGWFDRGQLEQVLLNLLKNAAESGSAADEVTLSVTLEPGGFGLVVADRGEGLSDEVAERALLPFYSTKPDGTGLGLALSRDIVVAHGGWLALSRRPGGGAEVRLWLPERSDAA